MWLDGCIAQFKTAKYRYHVASYPSKTVTQLTHEGCHMHWNFFGSGHGKVVLQILIPFPF